MEVPHPPVSPKSTWTPGKLSQTFSRFKGIVRIPGHRKPPSGRHESGHHDKRNDTKALHNSPYSRQSIAMKAYMSQPMLGRAELIDPRHGHRHPESSSSSISPTDHDGDEFPLPRPSPQIHQNAPSHDQRRHSRTLSLQSLHHSRSNSQEAPLDNNNNNNNDMTERRDVCLDSMEPPPLPPKPPSIYRNRRSENAQQVPPPSIPASDTPSSSGFRNLTRVLVRRASISKTRGKPRVGDEPPLPPLPSSLQGQRLEPSVSASTSSSAATATPETVLRSQSLFLSDPRPPPASEPSSIDHRPSNPSLAISAPTVPTAKNKKSVSSFVSTSDASFRTAASTFSSDNHNDNYRMDTSVTIENKKQLPIPIPPVPPIVIEHRAASTSDVDVKGVGNSNHDGLLRNEEAATSGSSTGATTTTTGKEAKGLGPLRIPMPRRFSFLSSEGTARLSPSLVSRPPPLPILNLPRLPTASIISTASASGGGSRVSRRSGTGGLSNMPALPLQGAGRGVGGHEERDVGDEDEDEEEEDGEDDEDEGDGDGDEGYGREDDEDSSHDQDPDAPRSSMSSNEINEGRNSYEHLDATRGISTAGAGARGASSASGQSFGPFHRKPELPPLHVSTPFTVRFPGPNSGLIAPTTPASATPPSSSVAKGKSKQVAAAAAAAPPFFVDEGVPGRPWMPPPSSSSSSHSSIVDGTVASSSSISAGVEETRGGGGGGSSSRYEPNYFDDIHGTGTAIRTRDYYYGGRSGTPAAASSSSSLLASAGVTAPQGQGHQPPQSFIGASVQTQQVVLTPGGSRGHAPLGSVPSSPLQTPRPDDYRFVHTRFPTVPAPPALSERIHSFSTLSSSNRDRNSAQLLNLGGMGGSLSVQRPSIYKHASRSLIDLHSIEKREEVERMVREGEEEHEKEMRRLSVRRNRESVVVTAASSSATSGNAAPSMDIQASRGSQCTTVIEEVNQEAHHVKGEEAGVSATRTTRDRTETVSEGVTDHDDCNVGQSNGGTRCYETVDETVQQNRLSSAPAYDAIPHPLRKRRSMPMFNEASTAPPPYPSFLPPHHHHPSARFASIQIQPRDDEGREELPTYSNTVYLKAILPRKMEFSGPGVQAKDRKWKRVLCVLEGTMLKVYKCPPGAGGVSVIEQWWESKVGVGDVAVHATGSTAGSSTAAGARPRASTGGASAKGGEEEKMRQQFLGAGTEVGVLSEVSRGLPSPSPSPYSSVRGKDSSQVALSRSALNIAVQFLKPGTRHMRSHSDVTPPSPTTMGDRLSTTRSSLSLSRSATPTAGSSTNSRSHSPMPSTSSATTTPSVVSEPSSSSSLGALSPSVTSRGSPVPVTPTSASSTRSRFVPRTPAQSHSVKGKEVADVPEPGSEDLIRAYSMQNAESGLGNDYLKRKNVIRVRLEGEQFLLQAKDVPSVVEWIEGLQAATNIALDLDVRPMPRGPIFPRRRRRRRPQVAPISTAGGPEGAAPLNPQGAMETYTPVSATAGQPALRRNQ